MTEPKRGSIWKDREDVAADSTNFSVRLLGKVGGAYNLAPGDDVVVYQSLTDGSIFVAGKTAFEKDLFVCVWPGPPYGE